MNSTHSEIFVNNSFTTAIESWFIPLDILGIVCNTVVMILAILFLLIILLDKTCWTVSMMLVAHSCLTELVGASVGLSIAIFTLQNDLKQIQYQDSFCIFRGYLSYTVCVLNNYSFLLHCIYRYVTAVYPTRLFWQSARTQLLIISLTWLFAFICPLPFIFTGEIIYNINNQICLLPLRFSFSLIFVALCAYVIPLSLLIFIYFKLVRYVQTMNQRVTPANTLMRSRRKLKMVRRTVILIMILFMLGFPYALFIFISYFTDPPKYHFRIALIFVYASLVFVIIALFQFTDTLKASVRKLFHMQANTVAARGT